MPGETYNHAISVYRKDEATRPIETSSTSVIGIVGTAPDRDVALAANIPVLLTSKADIAQFDKTGNGLGTLPQALKGIYDQAKCVVVVIPVDEGADAPATQSNVIGGVGVSGQYEGISALLVAKNKVKVKPLILCAPGFDHILPVAKELETIVERMKGFAYISAPDTTFEGSVTYRENFGSERVMVLYPWILSWDTATDTEITQPPSACAAGVRARVDNDKGFWYSISNNDINGITGLSKDVDYEKGDATCRAVLLNSNQVTTIVQDKGFRFFGLQTCSSDANWKYEGVVRSFDVLNAAVQHSFSWALDQPMDINLFEYTEDAVTSYIGSSPAFDGGECFADADLNTPANRAQGKAFFNMKATPLYPAENIVFYSIQTTDYMQGVG